MAFFSNEIYPDQSADEIYRARYFYEIWNLANH